MELPIKRLQVDKKFMIIAHRNTWLFAIKSTKLNKVSCCTFINSYLWQYFLMTEIWSDKISYSIWIFLCLPVIFLNVRIGKYFFHINQFTWPVMFAYSWCCLIDFNIISDTVLTKLSSEGILKFLVINIPSWTRSTGPITFLKVQLICYLELRLTVLIRVKLFS